MAGKRGNGEGNIRQRGDGRWEARLTIDGRSKGFYGKTRQEVASRMAAAIRDRDKGLPVIQDERQTVGAYLREWIVAVKPQIEPSSWRRYGDYVRIHLIPGLGKIGLARLTAQQVQGCYARLQEGGLSGTTVQAIHGMLHRALGDALRMGLVTRNVTELVRAPKRSTGEMHPLTKEQAQHFLAAVESDRFAALYVLALTSGMREGELLALHWQDVDCGRGTLQVRLGLQESKSELGRYILAEPKTDYSKRTIGLTETALVALRAHRARQAEERLRLGTLWEDCDLVFPNATGGLMIPDNLTKRSFKRHLREAGLPDIRFHDLRHTAATLMLAAGVNVKVVSEMLGHADISTTLRIYGHVLPHMQQQAVEVMDRLFSTP